MRDAIARLSLENLRLRALLGEADRLLAEAAQERAKAATWDDLVRAAEERESKAVQPPQCKRGRHG